MGLAPIFTVQPIKRLSHDANLYAGARHTPQSILVAGFHQAYICMAAIKAQAAGREPLSEVEVSGLFWLQSRLTRSKALMDLVLTGRATIGQRPNGEYMFAAR